MSSTSWLGALQPNATSFGYAAFLAVNAVGTWGGVFPFLPLKLQEPLLLLCFSVAQSIMFALVFFASVLEAFFLPRAVRRFIVRLSSLPYLAGWGLLIAAMYLDGWVVPLMIGAGALIGVGSAGFYLLWQRLFASQDSDAGDRDLILGTAIASLFYFALYLIPRAVTVYLIPLVITPFFALAIALKSRTINLEQPMFEDDPRSNPLVYRQTALMLMRPALCIGSLGLCSGLVRALAIEDPTVGSFVNGLSMGASFVAAIAFLALWRGKGVRLNVVALFRVVFPLVITGFLLLPFLGAPYGRWLSALLYAAYSVALMLMMIQCAQLSRDRGTSPLFVYGLFGGIVYTLHDAGFLGAALAEQPAIPGMSTYAVVALGAVYLLGFMYFFGQGGFRHAVSAGRAPLPDVELIPPASLPLAANGSAPLAARRPLARHQSSEEDAPPSSTSAGATASSTPPSPPQDHEPIYQDRTSKQVACVQQAFGLSAREAEVMGHLARGKTVARVAEELIISENTVRMHSKRIYAKLNVHKKQELIDLVESFDPPADL